MKNRQAVKRKKSTNKKIQNAKAVTVDGMNFKSSLEAFCWKTIQENGLTDVKYEEHKFVLQEAFNFPNSCMASYNSIHKDANGKKYKIAEYGEVSSNIRAITYNPDFCMIKEDKTGFIIETKGWATDAFILKWKMFKKHLTDNGYNLSLFLPTNQKNVLEAIKIIKSRYYR